MMKKRTIKPARIEPKQFDPVRVKPPSPEKVETPGVDPAQIAKDNLHWTTKAKLMIRPNSKLSRFLTGKNKAGRIFHAVLDVLPIPNVHEVIKRIVKESEHAGRAIGAIDIIRDTLNRLDWIRTAGAIIVSILLIRAAQWTGVDLEVLIELIRRVSDVI